MKRNIKIAVGCIVTIGLAAALLWHSAGLMEKKIGREKNAPFLEQEEDFDVLFMGTSHMGYGVYPMELWKDYGIVSYNLGGHGNPLATTYWTLENALDYTTPKLVVIDCFLLSYMVKSSESFSSVHISLDMFPLSRTKIAAAYDLLDDKAAEELFSGKEPRTRLEILWNYAIYHSRWNDLGEDDFAIDYTKEKGAEHYAGVVPARGGARLPADRKLEEDTVSMAYLRKMIEDCQDRGIDVLLTYLPFAADETCRKEANTVYDLAGEYGVDYLNFLDLDVVDYGTDYCDTDFHLNPSGARKVTDYIGWYVVENYGIPDHRKDEAYAGWYADYEAYAGMKEEELRSLESMDKYLMMLADKNYSAVIEVHDTALLGSDYYLSLLENLRIDTGKLTENTDFIIVQEAGKKTESLECFLRPGNSAVTPLGVFDVFEGEEDGAYGVSSGGEELYTVNAGQEPEADIRIVVFNRDMTELVDHSWFHFQAKFSR